MKITEEWEIIEESYGACTIGADDGATYLMDAPRAKRLVRLWNAFLGVPTNMLPKQRTPSEGAQK